MILAPAKGATGALMLSEQLKIHLEENHTLYTGKAMGIQVEI